MTGHRADIPTFEIMGAVFECWVVDNEYVWRSGDLSVRRLPGKANAAAYIAGRHVGTFKSIKAAMGGAAMAAKEAA
jgi:hypothetical protein